MIWDVAQLRHNASMLYNHLCSNDADRVYVDANGHFQLDERSWFWRLFTSLGDSSREATDALAIRTLRRVLNAVETGTLDPSKIIIQEQVPVGMFMDEGNGIDDWKAIKNHIVNHRAPLVSARPAPNRKWLNKKTFAMNVCNANRFKCWSRGGYPPDNELTREELIDRKVAVLAGQIMCGKEDYRSSRRDLPNFKFYDVSDDER